MGWILKVFKVSTFQGFETKNIALLEMLCSFETLKL